MTQATVAEVFTVYVNPATPIDELVEALARATGCRMGNVDVPWQVLDFKVSASQCSAVEMKMRLAVCQTDLTPARALPFIDSYREGTCRPANARELIIFLTTFVEEHLKYPIVAVGEAGDLRGPIVAYAYLFEGRRLIFVGRPSSDCKWGAGCQFLVVEK